MDVRLRDTGNMYETNVDLQGMHKIKLDIIIQLAITNV